MTNSRCIVIVLFNTGSIKPSTITTCVCIITDSHIAFTGGFGKSTYCRCQPFSSPSVVTNSHCRTGHIAIICDSPSGIRVITNRNTATSFRTGRYSIITHPNRNCSFLIVAFMQHRTFTHTNTISSICTVIFTHITETDNTSVDI